MSDAEPPAVIAFAESAVPRVGVRGLTTSGSQGLVAPLLLLWKGIGAYVSRHPEYSMLIGAVSVSNQYSPASRELIAR